MSSDDDIQDIVAQAISAPGEISYDIGQSFSSYTFDGTKGYDLFATAKRLSNNDEDDLYEDFEREFLENDLAQFLVLNLVSNLMDFRLEGERVQDVEDFFYANDTREQLFQFLTQAFVYGTGIGQRWEINGELVNATRVDVTSIKITKKPKVDRFGRVQFEFEQLREQSTDDEEAIKLKAKRVFTFKPIETPDKSYGISMMRSSLLPLQAIRQLNMDIPAGVKRLAYETLVLSLNLEGIPEEKQRSAITKSLKAFAKYDSATNTVLALDSRHELNYVGTKGGGGKTIQAILPLIEPLLIFLLNKWFVPLGDVLQGNSNRALSQTQTATAKARIKALKSKFATFVEKEIIAHILGEIEDDRVVTRPGVRVVHNESAGEIKEEVELMIELWNNNLLSREQVQEKLPFNVTEGTYLADLAGPVQNDDDAEEVVDETVEDEPEETET